MRRLGEWVHHRDEPVGLDRLLASSGNLQNTPFRESTPGITSQKMRCFGPKSCGPCVERHAQEGRLKRAASS